MNKWQVNIIIRQVDLIVWKDDYFSNYVDLSDIKLTSRWQLVASTRYKNKISITSCDDIFSDKST